MQMIIVFWWLVIIASAFRAKDIFITTFVMSQFLFVGLGLFLFSIVPSTYLKDTFSDFNFTQIRTSDFNNGSIYLLTGITASLLVFFALRMQTTRIKITAVRCTSKVNTTRFLGLAAAALIVSLYFIQENVGSFYYLVVAEQSEALADALGLRTSAVSNYFITLMIYNFCPAIAIIAIAWVREFKRSKLQRVLVAALIFTAIMALLLTFQKRPLIVFLFAILLIIKTRDKFYKDTVEPLAIFNEFIRHSFKYLLLLLLILFGLYFIYTGFRFSQSGILETSSSILEIIGTRVIGRLSIPAAFYANYFPDFQNHYWFSNVGLLSSIFGSRLFLDTSVVFSNYSYSNLDGSVAASVFADAYGQGGLVWVSLVGAFIGCILFSFRQVMKKANVGASKLIFMTFVVMYIYYLSQASLFRASLGYGGLIWLVIWIFITKKNNRNVSI